MTELKFSKKEIKQIRRLVRLHMRPLDCGKSAVRRLMRELEEDFELWLNLKQADCPPVMSEEQCQQMMSKFLENVNKVLEEKSNSPLLISGSDLIAIGIPQGKLLGAILKQLDELIIEQPVLNSREILLERARAIWNSKHA